MSTPTAYPLTWPLGYPRTVIRAASRFGTNVPVNRKRTTLTEAVQLLQAELDRLHAFNIVLSSNLELRLDGLPRGNQGKPHDPGVAVYFKLKGKDIVLPCDRWDKVECNIIAIAKHIEAMRGTERWGVGTVERAFDGYARLPETAVAETCWQILGIDRTASASDIKLRFRHLAIDTHPDRGGTHEAFARINNAWEQAKQERADLQ